MKADRSGQGQRQLLALARGLLKLRNSNFLIMDESTANLDHATDMTIQNVLRTTLGDTQMLVIAHRLLTVAGLDKILVLDHGKVVEFGTPWELLQNDSGVFRDLARQSGEESQLFEVSRDAIEAGRGVVLVDSTDDRWQSLSMTRRRRTVRRYSRFLRKEGGGGRHHCNRQSSTCIAI